MDSWEKSWSGADWDFWSQGTSQEYQPKVFHPKENRQKESQPYEYHPKERAPKSYPPKEYLTRDNHFEAFSEKTQHYGHPKDHQNQSNQDNQARTFQPSRPNQSQVEYSGNLNTFQRQNHGPTKYDDGLRKVPRHIFNSPNRFEECRTGMDVMGTQVENILKSQEFIFAFQNGLPDISDLSEHSLDKVSAEALDSATYLGSVSGSDPTPVSTQPFLQYVDSGEFASPTYAPGTVYVSPSLYPAVTSPSTTFDTSFYTGLNASSTANTLGTTQSQLVSYAGSTFLIQPSPDGSSTPLITAVARQESPDSPSLGGSELSPSHQLSYATRVSPATIQWLIANYETAEGVSLPRSTLYSHYLKHCSESRQDPVNAASFGKLIRSVFLGLRTRRIGTRGNSKYHYYGIRVKPGSLLQGVEEGSPPPRPPVAKKKNGGTSKTSSGSDTASQPDQSVQVSSSLGPASLGQYLGPAAGGVTLPPLNLGPEDLPDGVDQEAASVFSELYRQHLNSLLEAVVSLSFASIQHIWADFWDLSDSGLEEAKLPLSKATMRQLLTVPALQTFIQEGDFAFYQSLVQILIPEVLRPIPPSLTQAIRNFAKSLESWLTAAMADCPADITTIKLATVRSFSQTLRRYTSLNHLAQAARAVLQNQAQITQMLADLNRVDFANVQEQASWVCGCDEDVVSRLEESFKSTLEQEASLETWASWLEGVVDTVLAPHVDTANYAAAARQFLLRWSFYSSMIIRDLTLRSAASFGSFHLIRLLYDEFMFYIIEHRVATQLKQTPVAVMGSRKLMDYLADTTPAKPETEKAGEVVEEKQENNNEVEMNSWTLEKDA